MKIDKRIVVAGAALVGLCVVGTVLALVDKDNKKKEVEDNAKYEAALRVLQGMESNVRAKTQKSLDDLELSLKCDGVKVVEA